MIRLCDDKLKRGVLLDKLFDLFDTYGNFDDGGLTISINGKFGSGKTTFLDFIEEKNKTDKKYHIVRYNAWENNLFENPLIPILNSFNCLESRNDKIKKGAKSILKNIPKMLIGTISNITNIDLTSLKPNENIFEDFNKYKIAISKYKEILTEFTNDKKIIILVDELDRCLPQYQIKVLETLYNIFNIPNLILVIALDKTQLEHSIKQLFGNETNMSGYLSKFIQYEIELPEDQNNAYLQTLLEFNCEFPEIKKYCAKMFDLVNLSLRDCKQIVKQMNLICSAVDDKGQSIKYDYWYPLFICLVLIIKKIEKEIYKNYFYNEISYNERTEILPLNKTSYNGFITQIKNTKIAKILNFFNSKKMPFAFILYLIDFFYPVSQIEISSLVEYTKISQDRIESILDSRDFPSWRYDYNSILNKIKLLYK